MLRRDDVVYILTICIFCMPPSFPSISCPDFCNCDSEGVRIMCLAKSDIQAGQILQISLPYNTSSLFVLFLPNVTQIDISFCKNVTENSLIELRLEGHENISPWKLRKRHMSCFGKLRVLQLRDVSINSIERETLSDVIHLEEFDVSRNRDLEIDYVIEAFRNSTVPKLRTFNISMINSRDDTNFIILGHAFFSIFKETDLQVLDFSWTRTSLLTVPVSYYIPKVLFLNMSGTFLAGNSVCMSSGLRLKHLQQLECNNWPLVVKSKRSTRSVEFPSCNSSYAGTYLTDDCYNIPPGLKVLYLQNINRKFIYFNFSTNLCFNPSNVLTFLSLRGLSWSSERPFSVIKGFVLLETFDLSGCGLETISSETFRYMPSLKYLDLSNNNIHTIDLTSFALNGNLSVLDLSRNGLESFPLTLISANFLIKTLNLSQNVLKAFSLKLGSKFSLTTIDVSYNKIKALELSEFYPLDYIENAVNETKISINITSNSFICDCSTDSARFMEWFLNSKNSFIIQLVPDSIVCVNYDSTTLGTYTTYSQIMNEMCEGDHLPLILGISISIYIFLCITLLITFSCCRKLARKRLNMKRPAVSNPYAVVSNPKYAVFIAVSSNDNEFVINHVLPKLEQELKNLISIGENSDMELIAWGEHVELGQFVMPELARLIDLSLCMIVILSDNFLNSKFCEYELQLASELKRRIILLYIQDCKQTLNDKGASMFVQNVLRSYTYKQWPSLNDTENCVNEVREEQLIKKLAHAIKNIYEENEKMKNSEREKNINKT